MKKLIIPAFLMLASFTGCDKEDDCPDITATAPASEVTTLRQYITSNNISATEDKRGFFYTITSPGSSERPSACSNVKVKYTGRLINGNIFDNSATAVEFDLDGLITGWKAGLPLVGEGGKITLYLPPFFAYGSTGSGASIPPNSITIFDIELLAAD